MSEQRKYRKFTSKRKLEIVLASLRGDRSVAEICREHGIAESLLRKWREQALEAAAERFWSGRSDARPTSWRGCRANPACRPVRQRQFVGRVGAGWEVGEMAFNFVSCDREQEFLLPPSLREWLPEDHLAWFLIDAVEGMDLSAFMADYRADGWGRAADPDPGSA